jgi:predicted PurR-regulated permease PerM
MEASALRLATDDRAAGEAPAAALSDEIAPPPEPTGRIRVPPDVKTVFQGGLFALALLAACYAGAQILLPIVLAFVLKLTLQPAMRPLERLQVPRAIAALLLIVVLFGALVGLGMLLSSPAVNWAQRLSGSLPKLQERLSYLSSPIQALERFLDHAQNLLGMRQATIAVEGSRLSDRVLDGTRFLLTGFFETVLVLFFLLVSGDTFLRRLVEVLPRFKDKRQVVDISQQIERDIAAYLATITVMNAAVGTATGVVMALCGLGDPVFWGTVAFLLNYLPILGPLIGLGVFFLAGLVSIEPLWAAFLPAALYLGIHVVEGEAVTPMLLARRFTLNRVLVIVGIIFWFWMWGVPGAILSTPMLAVAKIICDRIHSLTAVGHLIEG